MYVRPRPLFGGLAGGIFLIFLALSFISGHFIISLLFVGLAFASLLGSLAGGNPRSIYGGVMGFIWMLGLAAIFAFNFWWPGILILVAISAIVGSAFRPRESAPQQPYYQPSQQQQQPYYQPSQQSEQPYQPYQEGYQPPQQQEGYQEGGKAYPYPQQPEQGVQDYEQPTAQYPQELPPQQ